MVNKSIQKSAISIFVAGMIVIGGISCTAYRNFQMEVLEPAPISIDVNKRMALYDRNIRNAESALRIKKNDDTEYHLLREFANGLNNHKATLGKDTIIFFRNHQHTLLENCKSPEYLPFDTLDYLYKKYQIDYLLSLEMISYKMQEDDINCYWMLRIYHQGVNSPIDSVIINESLYVNPEKNGVMFEDLAATYWDGGYAYAHRIFPTWIKTGRRIYRQGRILALGNAYMETEQIEKAVELWSRISDMQTKKGVKACLNLACLYESISNYIEAQHYLEQAYKLAQKINANSRLIDYIQKYMEILNKRIHKESILEKQINIGS